MAALDDRSPADCYRNETTFENTRVDSDNIVDRIIKRRSTTFHENNFNGVYRGDNMFMGNKIDVGGNLILNGTNPGSRDERSAILNWLSPLTFRQIHEDIAKNAVHQDQSAESRRRGDFSGKWLLESETFDRWRSREIRRLWYHGMRECTPSLLSLAHPELTCFASWGREDRSSVGPSCISTCVPPD